MLFADPAKYEYHTCEQINAAGNAMVAREATLRELIEKAERGAAGTLVSTLAYRGDHRAAVEEIAIIEVAARRRNCITPKSWRSNTVIQ